MTMKRPDARVVGVDLNGHISIRLKHLHVPTGRVGRVDDGSIPSSEAFTQHEHVVAVDVHRMRDGRLVVDDNNETLVATEVVHVPFGVVGVRIVSGGREHKHGVVVVDAEAGAVHGP